MRLARSRPISRTLSSQPSRKRSLPVTAPETPQRHCGCGWAFHRVSASCRREWQPLGASALPVRSPPPADSPPYHQSAADRSAGRGQISPTLVAPYRGGDGVSFGDRHGSFRRPKVLMKASFPSICTCRLPLLFLWGRGFFTECRDCGHQGYGSNTNKAKPATTTTCSSS